MTTQTATTPTIGLFSINMYAAAAPGAAAHLATLAEKLGYESVWAGEHVVLPSPRVAPSPMDPDDPALDPLIALSHVAAVTRNIRLGTGIIILPQRNPLVLAKQLASLDVMSNGRLIFGMGVGYLEPELRAIGVPVEDRIEMSREYLAAIRSLWYDDAPAYEGKFVRFENIDAHPRPLQRPLPVVMGGAAPAALRRAAEGAEGWYGWWLDESATETAIATLRGYAERAGREKPLEISITPAGRLTPERVAAYGALGVDRLIVVPPNRPLADVEAFVEGNAPEKVGARRAPWAEG